MSHHFWIIALLTLHFTRSVHNANILGIYPLAGFSHFIVIGKLMEELAKRGHNVDVVSHFPRDKPLAGYTDLSLKGLMPSTQNRFSVDSVAGLTNQESMDIILGLCGMEVCKVTFESQVMKDLRDTKKRYDLIVTELFGADCMFGFGHHLRTPVVAFTTSTNMPWGGHRIGNPDNPSYISTYFMPYSSKMTLFERFMNTVNVIQSKISHHIHLSSQNKIVRDFFGENIPDINKLVSNVSLLLVNSHFSLNQANPTVPNFIEVGGIQISEPRALNQHFKEIVETEKKVIYFSLGSMITSESFSLEKLQAFCDAFKELPYKILWRTKKESLPRELDVPDNVHFEPWFPQVDLLCHPNAALLISHGGLLSIQEAVYCGIPSLAIPMFADHGHNAQLAVVNGLGKVVESDEISKQRILLAVKDLLENPKYKMNAERLSREFKDRPLSPMDTAIYWIEYVIRHNGAPQLHCHSADLAWYQYYLIDIAFILIIFLLTFIMLLSKIYVKFISNVQVKNKKS